MAQYNFEGDLENISEGQLEFINKVVLEQDLKVKKVVFSQVGQPGDNFVANVKRISIEGENVSMKMILKVAPVLDIIRNTTNVIAAFNNEHTIYSEVLPKFVQLQKNAGVPEDEQLRYAKCYGSQNEAPNEIIILEDLNELDFVMLSKYDSLSDECVRSVLKDFAKLHALSYVLKKKEPETYDLYTSKLISNWEMLATPQFAYFLQMQETVMISILDDEGHKSFLKNKVMDGLKLIAKITKDDKYSVIHQGDAWTNNIMFKFVGDSLAKSIMIDYQQAKSSNPVTDLMYMIFNCTDYETRAKNYFNWIDYYHTELDNFLSHFGLKANFEYSRDQLDADLKRYGKIMFSLCLIMSYVMMTDSKEAAAMMEALKDAGLTEATGEVLANLPLANETKLRLKNRVVGLIKSFTEFGLL